MRRRESRVRRGTFAVAPASGGTTTSCAAETGPSSVSTVSSASTGVERRTTARAIGPSSKWSAAEVTAPDDVSAEADRRAVRGQHAVAAVELQRDQAARRVTEVVHLRDGLLAAVAALAEVHGGAQPVQFVGQHALVDVGRPARAPGGDPQRIGGGEAGEREFAARRRHPRSAAPLRA